MSRAQSLVEFAIVLPLFLALVGGIVQFGVAFWAQNTLTQVARDVGRWAATQQTPQCNSATARTKLAAQADLVARQSSLIGYSAGMWNSAGPWQTNRPNEGIEADWPPPTNPPFMTDIDCPPSTNETAWFVQIRVSHRVPTFFPGLQYLPGLGTCDATGCYVSLSSNTTFRMEPAPAPVTP